MILSKPPKTKIHGKTFSVLNIFENRIIMNMKLIHMDLEAILNSFWAHLVVLRRPLGAILDVLGPT